MRSVGLGRLSVIGALVLVALSAVGVAAGFREATPAPRSAGAFPLQEQFVRVVKTVAPSVVQIETGGGLGSGVVYDGRGHVVTNAHVVGSSRTFEITLADGRRYPGTLVGRYVPEDMAVIRIDAPRLKPATFADSSTLEVGDFAIAIGNPLGLRSSVTEGIVSALARTATEPNGAVLPNVIQTSAPINPGNSGGALVDLAGRVIGIPTLGAGGSSGIGFAIASERVRIIAPQLIERGRVVSTGRAFLGVRLASVADADGAVVSEVVANGPAARAGVRPGDVILAIDGRPTPSSSDLASALARRKPGHRAVLDVVRQGGARTRITVVLGELPTP